MIIIPRKHYTQPPSGPLDVCDEWASAGFVFADLPGRRLKSAPATGVLSPVAVANGVALRTPNVNNTHETVIAPSVVFDCRHEFTCVAVATRRGGHTSYPAFFCRQHPVEAFTGGRAGFAHHNSSGNVYFFYRNAADAAWVETTPHSSPIGERVVWIAARSISGGVGTLRLYRNGELVNTITAGDGGTPTADSRVRYGHHGISSSIAPAANDLELAAWSVKPVTAEQARAISNNPYQLFRADPVRIYSFPSGTIVPTLSAASFAGRIPSVSLSY